MSARSWQRLPLAASAPTRADLAGGTLDLWPLYLFHPGSRTVNLALDLRVEVRLESHSGGYALSSLDAGRTLEVATLAEVPTGGTFALVAQVLAHFGAPDGIAVTTRSPAPRGSGLGASSALAIALVAAVAGALGRDLARAHMVPLARDLESRVLGKPAGIQDYYPAVFGGGCVLTLAAGEVTARRDVFDAAALARHLTVVYCGVSHFSAENNWDVYRGALEGRGSVHAALAGVAGAARDVHQALAAGDLPAAGRGMSSEWAHRRELAAGIATPEIDRIMDAALDAGSWGGKVCGAGGGGCLVFLHPEERQQTVVEAVTAAGGSVLDTAPDRHGVRVGT